MGGRSGRREGSVRKGEEAKKAEADAEGEEARSRRGRIR